MDLGGIAAASWVTPGGMTRVLVNGGSTSKGLFLMVVETCARRLAPGITWVDLPTINPVQYLLEPLLRDERGRLPMIQSLRDDATLRHDGPHSLLVPDFYVTTGDFDAGFPGYAAMASKLGRALLASLPAPAIGTGDAVARPLLWDPHNEHSDRTLRRSSKGARVLSPSFVGLLCSSMMTDNTACAARIFTTAQGNLLEILDVQKWRPPTGETG